MRQDQEDFQGYQVFQDLLDHPDLEEIVVWWVILVHLAWVRKDPKEQGDLMVPPDLQGSERREYKVCVVQLEKLEEEVCPEVQAQWVRLVIVSSVRLLKCRLMPGHRRKDDEKKKKLLDMNQEHDKEYGIIKNHQDEEKKKQIKEKKYKEQNDEEGYLEKRYINRTKAIQSKMISINCSKFTAFEVTLTMRVLCAQFVEQSFISIFVYLSINNYFINNAFVLDIKANISD